MTDIYGLPQPLTGNEIVTIEQMQNGQLVLCSMPLSELIPLVNPIANAPTTLPATPGIYWNNGGVICLS